MTAPPYALLAELTHRCPLRCPYCSNPLELARLAAERDTAFWTALLREAAALGVLQVHFSGGEPTLRRDLEALVAAAEGAGLYSNLITAGVLLSPRRLAALRQAGLQHVQISLQDDRAAEADAVAGGAGWHAKKLAALRLVAEAGMALTVNVVLHRANLGRVPQLIALALEGGAQRLELAQTQYHGWALHNRDALLPEASDLRAAEQAIEAAQQALSGRLVIDYVPADYFAARPKPCMSGWGRRFLVVDPLGRVLPCHHAASLPGPEAPRYEPGRLGWIWQDSPLFNRFRGTAWMPQPCQGCAERERDWGGCRCQAHALTGEAAATDPACAFSPRHAALAALQPGPAAYRHRPPLHRLR